MRTPHLKPLPPLHALLALTFILVAPLALTGCAGGGDHDGPAGDTAGEAPAPGGSGDAAAEISTWQAKRDESARASAMSPFTAVESYYVDEGVTAKIGTDGSRIVRDPEPSLSTMAAITYRDDAFWIEPVGGSRAAFVHLVDEEGEPEAGGTEVDEPRRIEGEEVVSMDRFFFALSPQSGFGRIIAYDPESAMKKEFHGFKWFPPAPGLRVMARWVAAAEPAEVTVGTSRGLEKTFFRAGHLEFEVDGTPQTLVALTDGPNPEKGDSLFLPFQDMTTGKETYQIGRYISVSFRGEGEEHLIDFNKATNPLCNYSTHYNCPLPPDENRLSVAIRAGEMTYPAHG